MSAIVPSLRKAIENYRISVENLWVVFTVMPAVMRKLGHPPVSHNLFMAGSGSQGRGQIEAVERSNPGFLGCFSLQQLQTGLGHLDSQAVLEAESRGLAKILPKSLFYIPAFSQDHSVFSLLQVRSATLASALSSAQQAHPELVLGFGGTREDLLALVLSMERVVSTQDFLAVETDRGDPILTWDADRILSAKKHPELVAKMRPDRNQSEEG